MARAHRSDVHRRFAASAAAALIIRFPGNCKAVATWYLEGESGLFCKNLVRAASSVAFLGEDGGPFEIGVVQGAA